MAGKKRSGLANDRRAYCYIYQTSGCPSIIIADIATFDGTNWILNNNTTILACQTLTIGLGISLIVPDGIILTNNGTIISNGELRNVYGGTINNYGTIEGGIVNYSYSFINYGTINILDGKLFANSWNGGENSGALLANIGNINIMLGGILAIGRSIIENNNAGNINNRGMITSLEAVINNNNGGNITNNNGGVITNENATITNNTGGTITNNNGGTITNGVLPTSSTINNAGGTITNNNGGTINNPISCTIFNNTGGTIIQNNGATFTNNGIINNANGSSSCGIGTIIGTISGTFGTDCP